MRLRSMELACAWPRLWLSILLIGMGPAALVHARLPGDVLTAEAAPAWRLVTLMRLPPRPQPDAIAQQLAAARQLARSPGAEPWVALALLTGGRLADGPALDFTREDHLVQERQRQECRDRIVRALLESLPRDADLAVVWAATGRLEEPAHREAAHAALRRCLSDQRHDDVQAWRQLIAERVDAERPTLEGWPPGKLAVMGMSLAWSHRPPAHDTEARLAAERLAVRSGADAWIVIMLLDRQTIDRELRPAGVPPAAVRDGPGATISVCQFPDRLIAYLPEGTHPAVLWAVAETLEDVGGEVAADALRRSLNEDHGRDAQAWREAIERRCEDQAGGWQR